MRKGIAFLIAITVIGLTSWTTTAFAQEERSKIVIGVLASGEVPDNVVQDIQDLFLAALARYSEYELVDREAVFLNTDLGSDVDLLLCMNQTECIERLYDEHGYEQYVLVKVEESSGEIAFTATSFNYKSSDPLNFGETYTVPSDDVDALIERAFAVAEEVDLDLDISGDGGTDVVTTGCPEGCPADQKCVDNQCVAEDVVLPPEEPVEPGAGPDWLLITGYGLAGVGAVTGVLAIVFWVDAQSALDDFGKSYSNNSSTYISNKTQKAAASDVDSINTSANVSQAMLWIAIPTLAAGAGLITWRLLADDGAEADTDSAGDLSISPHIGPDGAGVGARVTF